jgi:hypothetical protein
MAVVPRIPVPKNQGAFEGTSRIPVSADVREAHVVDVSLASARHSVLICGRREEGADGTPVHNW